MAEPVVRPPEKWSLPIQASYIISSMVGREDHLTYQQNLAVPGVEAVGIARPVTVVEAQVNLMVGTVEHLPTDLRERRVEDTARHRVGAEAKVMAAEEEEGTGEVADRHGRCLGEEEAAVLASSILQKL